MRQRKPYDLAFSYHPILLGQVSNFKTFLYFSQRAGEENLISFSIWFPFNKLFFVYQSEVNIFCRDLAFYKLIVL